MSGVRAVIYNPVIVDLSHYDDVQDWDAVAAFPIWGVINKATESTGYVDPTLAIRRQPVADHGLLYGAYHFLRPSIIKDQVDHFLNTVSQLAGWESMLLALDHEDDRVSLAHVEEFMARVYELTNRYAVLYSGHVIKEQLGTKISPLLANHKLWLCHYSSNPTWPPNWAEPWIIQFTGDGQGPEPHHVPGIVTQDGCDINHYGYSMEQLTSEWAGTVAVA